MEPSRPLDGSQEQPNPEIEHPVESSPPEPVDRTQTAGVKRPREHEEDEEVEEVPRPRAPNTPAVGAQQGDPTREESGASRHPARPRPTRFTKIVTMPNGTNFLMYTPTHDEDITIVSGVQATWSIHNLPDILYFIRPQPEHAISAVPRHKADCLIFGNVVNHYDVLPVQISSLVEGWRVEAWMRLDGRITAEDIIDRVIPKYRSQIAPGGIELRRSEFRELFYTTSWGWGDTYKRVTQAMKAKGLNPKTNSTRGLTPGLVSPEMGILSSRIPVPEYVGSQVRPIAFLGRQVFQHAPQVWSHIPLAQPTLAPLGNYMLPFVRAVTGSMPYPPYPPSPRPHPPAHPPARPHPTAIHPHPPAMHPHPSAHPQLPASHPHHPAYPHPPAIHPRPPARPSARPHPVHPFSRRAVVPDNTERDENNLTRDERNAQAPTEYPPLPPVDQNELAYHGGPPARRFQDDPDDNGRTMALEDYLTRHRLTFHQYIHIRYESRVEFTMALEPATQDPWATLDGQRD
ncbi:hypothetical protein AOCH_007177 [Aspergillus ochraceoroseus]|uniref:Uncharacterized protein n=1 Tax=Aspergillus ochraceoroseus TaxID=138278 RepID=A0A0F8W7Z1_9EURO|nr:hypothetical protein AOCH_007177 [Aspergillus ochraceoroseus]